MFLIKANHNFAEKKKQGFVVSFCAIAEAVVRNFCQSVDCFFLQTTFLTPDIFYKYCGEIIYVKRTLLFSI